MVENFPHRATFHDTPGVHHHDAVAHLRHDAKVVGDEDEREIGFLWDLAQQAKVLSLEGHAQRRGGLVGDDDPRLAGDGEGADDALLHAAADLVWIVLPSTLGRRPAPLLKAIDGPPYQRPMAVSVVDLDGFDQLVADGEHRIEGGLRVLENHGDAPSPDGPHLTLALLQKIFPFEHDLSLDDTGGRPGHQSQQRQRGHGLPTPRLAHDSQRFALPQVKAHSIDGLHHAPPGKAIGVQVLDFQNDTTDLSGHAPPAPSPGGSEKAARHQERALLMSGGLAVSYLAVLTSTSRP